MSKHLSQSDARRYGVIGDPNFSEARNRAIYKEVERKAKLAYKRKQKMIEDGLAERADVVYSYIRNQMSRGKEMQIDEYTGWYNMKKLWGETRVRELQEAAIKKGFIIKGFN